MGNCLNTAAKQGRHEMVMPEEKEEEEEEEEEGGGLQLRRSISQVLQEEQEEAEEAASMPEAAGLKVKIVLTRAELEWLMAQLKTGERRLEDVLHQMGNARADKQQPPPPPPPRDGWRPRLESILECPETSAGFDAT